VAYPGMNCVERIGIEPIGACLQGRPAHQCAPRGAGAPKAGIMSRRPDSNWLPAAYKAAALPGELRRHVLPIKDSNLAFRVQSAAACRLAESGITSG
jgi:hypothetical protein